MELKYFQGSQQIQRDSILECVSSQQRDIYNMVLREAEAKAKKYPKQGMPVVVVTGRGKKQSACTYTVICE